MIKAHVICANDSVEFVVLGDIIRAETKKEELAEESFKKNPWPYRDGANAALFAGTTPYEKYRGHVYWHIHTVDAEDAS